MMKLYRQYGLKPIHSVMIVVVMLVQVMGLNAQQASNTKALPKFNFSNIDIFKSAVFLENRNIVEPYKGRQVLYYTNHNKVNAFFTETGVIYKIQCIDKKEQEELIKEKEKEYRKHKGAEKEEEGRVPISTSIITMDFEGANPHPQIEVKEKGEGYYNYIKREGAGYKNLTTEGYQRIVYKQLYPGIDVEYYFPDKGGIEYNLIVSPGADPAQVKMVYSGMLKKVFKNADGDVVVHTRSGDLVQHAPVTYTTGGVKVASQFSVSNKTVQFQFPQGYDNRQAMVIDPWVVVMTQLPPENVGLRVDYDYLGNLLVYGAGPTYDQDISTYFQVAKYSSGGVYQWTFMGNVTSVGWSTIGVGWNEIGGFITEKTSGKSYMSPGYVGSGSQIVRISAAGLYDNFISVVNSNFQEAWGFAYNCIQDNVLALGGGTNSNLNMGSINPVTGVVSTANITGITSGDFQDILCGTYDTAGNLYVIINDGLGILPYTNTIYKVNSTYNGFVWNANSTFTPFQEVANDPYWGAGNWFNGLASNSNYLYYYDGTNVAAYQYANGAMVGTSYAIAGYVQKYQAGIAVDNCDHVYVGGRGVIKTFTFNGATFTPGADIPLGVGFAGDVVFDVKYNSSNNLLYVTGDSMVGTYIATLSTNCSVVQDFTVAHTTTCNTATATVTPSANLNPVVFNYVWLDANNNVVSQSTSSASVTNTATGLSPGTYYVQVQWNTDCGGTAVTDTVHIHCGSDSISPDTTICRGNSVQLSLTASPTGGTYAWTPGGYNTAIINVSPTITTTYIVTYTPPTGAPVVDSVHVTVLQLATVTVNDTAICRGDTATLSATPSMAGGTYSWLPGGEVTSSIIVSPLVTSTYHVTYTAQCNAPVDSGTVTVQTLSLTPHSATACQGSAANISVTPSTGGGTYLWMPGGYNTQAISVSPVNAGSHTYTVTYTQALCTAVDSAFAVIDSMPTLAIANDTICQGSQAALTSVASLPGGTYSWAPGNFATANIAISPTQTTTYRLSYNVAGCMAIDSAAVVVDAMPVLTMTGDSVCLGNQGQVSVSASIAGGNYLWTTGETTAAINASPTVTTAYTVTYTEALCVVSASTGINVMQPPTLTPHGTTVCQGSTANISVTPSITGGSYLWAPGGFNTQAITVVPINTGSYEYTVTYTQGLCTVIDSAALLVDSIPVLAIANDTICQGSQGSLQAVASLPGGTYSWAPGNFGTANISISPTQTTTYRLAYNLAGCIAVDSAAAVVDPMPVLTMTGDSVCIGMPGQVSASPSVNGGTYLWSTNDNTASATISPGSTTSYTVTYTAALCVVSGSATITVLALPTLAVTGDTVCSGTAVNLTATPTYGIGTYSWSPGGYQTQTVSVSPMLSTTYTVTFTMAGCGIAVDSAMIKEWPIPTVTTTDTAFCNGFSGSISATPSVQGGTYQWAPGGGNTPAITVSPGATTVYTVTYNAHGCIATGNATATVHTNPTVQVTGTNATCGVPNGIEVAQTTSGAVPYTYLWSNAATTATINQLAGNQAYSLTVLDTYQCSVTGSAFISQATVVTAAATGVNERCPGYSDGWAGATAAGGLTPYSYIWSNQQPTTNISGLAPGNYVVTVSDITGCTASAQVSILDAAANTFNATAQPTSCYGPQYQDGSLSVAPVTMLRSPYRYALNAGAYQSNDTFTNLAYGFYNVTVMDDSGCIVTINNIDVPEAAEAYLSVTPADATVNLGQTVTLAANLEPYPVSSIVSYLWSPGEFLSCVTCPNPVVTPYSSVMTYTVALVYNDHCTIDAAVTVHMDDNPDVFIPNVFTPNGDGNNDIFYVYGPNIKQFNIKIFNRWGEKVFESNDQQTGWDGRFKGIMQEPNVFVYETYIVLLDNTTFHKTGSVTLVR